MGSLTLKCYTLEKLTGTDNYYVIMGKMVQGESLTFLLMFILPNVSWYYGMKFLVTRI